MRNLEDYDDRLWERLFNLVFPDEATMTRTEVQSELRQLRIDVRPALDKVLSVLKHSREARSARAALESAKERRPSLLARVTGIEAPSVPDIRGALRRMIAERLAGPEQAAYFRKLETADSDQDLRTLLDDISRLEEFSKQEETGDVEP